ncbi:MAG: helix-turn-helix transcriptional regulator [Bdellovibrionota bacterium]
MSVHFDRTWFAKAKKTQREVAREIGIDEAYLSKVVRGQIEPSVVKAIRIARCLGCAVEDLYGRGDGGSAARKARSARRGRR